MIIEGYAALFGVEDHMRDIVRAGALAASLQRRAERMPILVEHEPRLLAGYWTDVREDGRGLWLRGDVRDELPGAARAKRALGVSASASFRLEVYRREDVRAGWRVLWGERVLAITGVVDDGAPRMTLLCSEERP